MKDIKSLLENEYVQYHGVHSVGVVVDVASTKESEFDLDDFSPLRVLPPRTGKLSIRNGVGQVEIVGYEALVKQCTKPASFLEGRKTCDLLLTTCDRPVSFLLIEITSAKDSIANLIKPIYKGRTQEIAFPGGKFQKGEEQLFQSLQDLLCVPKIATELNAYSNRVCLLAYSIVTPEVQKQFGFSLSPYSRYLKIESARTGDNGAQISCPRIEDLGFELRRISHEYSYEL